MLNSSKINFILRAVIWVIIILVFSLATSNLAKWIDYAEYIQADKAA